MAMFTLQLQFVDPRGAQRAAQLTVHYLMFPFPCQIQTCPSVQFLPLFPLQAKHIMSCYWGASSSAAERHDPSLPYLEQYRIDCGQFVQLFSALAPWSCGMHTSTLSARLFRLLDHNKDTLINFKEFVTGLSEYTTRSSS